MDSAVSSYGFAYHICRFILFLNFLLYYFALVFICAA